MDKVVIIVRRDSSLGGFIKVDYEHYAHLTANTSAVHFESRVSPANPEAMNAVAAIAIIGSALSGNVELRRLALQDISQLKAVPLSNGVELKFL